MVKKEKKKSNTFLKILAEGWMVKTNSVEEEEQQQEEDLAGARQCNSEEILCPEDPTTRDLSWLLTKCPGGYKCLSNGRLSAPEQLHLLSDRFLRYRACLGL